MRNSEWLATHCSRHPFMATEVVLTVPPYRRPADRVGSRPAGLCVQPPSRYFLLVLLCLCFAVPSVYSAAGARSRHIGSARHLVQCVPVCRTHLCDTCHTVEAGDICRRNVNHLSRQASVFTATAALQTHDNLGRHQESTCMSNVTCQISRYSSHSVQVDELDHSRYMIENLPGGSPSSFWAT